MLNWYYPKVLCILYIKTSFFSKFHHAKYSSPKRSSDKRIVGKQSKWCWLMPVWVHKILSSLYTIHPFVLFNDHNLYVLFYFWQWDKIHPSVKKDLVAQFDPFLREGYSRLWLILHYSRMSIVSDNQTCIQNWVYSHYPSAMLWRLAP